ncbi:MAG: SIS domain-containing protein, partial [Clostridia bacterium]|nr:SIS domain-containing protein [Clostridia bacterium]
MNSKKILVVGSLVEDLITQTKNIPNSGETVFGLNFSNAAGGKGANQAAAAARLGGDVIFVGQTGDDVFSRDLTVALRDSGIDTTKILRKDHSSSGVSAVTVEVKEDGNLNRICCNPGANMLLTIDDVKFLEKEIQNYGALILQFEIPMEVNEYLAKLAHDNGVFVAVNPAPYQPLSKTLLENIDLLVPNEHEASGITGIKLANDDATKEEVLQMGKAILSCGVKNVIITLGKNGSALINDQEIYFNPAVPGVKSIDPTAAGDTYLGSLIAAIINGFDIKEAMKIASYCSAIAVSKLGALPAIPFTRETVEWMNEKGDTSLAKRLEETFGLLPTLSERLDYFKTQMIHEVNETFTRIDYNQLFKAMDLILHSERNGGRVHITGIGKPGHVAAYMASLLSSTGTPTYFLHGTECVHGSAGQLVPGDVVICISNSGETVELKATIH